MHWQAAIRIAFLSTTWIFTSAVNADQELDEMVMARIMPRFDQEARASMEKSGVRHLSTYWNGETRTLIAVGELGSLGSAEFSRVAMTQNVPAKSHSLKQSKIDEICQHSGVYFIKRFLKKHKVRLSFVYNEHTRLVEPLVVEISHHDLSVCA